MDHLELQDHVEKPDLLDLLAHLDFLDLLVLPAPAVNVEKLALVEHLVLLVNEGKQDHPALLDLVVNVVK